jgi:hypothetical protein
MRFRSGLVVLASLAVLSAETGAQQASPRYYRVVEWESPPGEMGAFRTSRFGGLSKLYSDAKATTGFVIYTTENRTAIARQVDPKDLFSNPNAAIQAANPDAYRAWQAGLSGNSVVTRNEIWVEIPAHTYEPANAPQATGVSSASVRVAAGKGAAFDSARRDFVKFRQKIGYPYPVRAYRVVIGEVRNVYVTHFDSREKFFGPNTLATLVEKAGAGAEWQALGARLVGSMGMDWSSTLWNFGANLSYVPQP